MAQTRFSAPFSAPITAPTRPKAAMLALATFTAAHVCALIGCTSPTAGADPTQGPTADRSEHGEASDLSGTLAAYLTGSFSSAAQAESDPDNFFDIRLHAVEIWTDRDDGPWLYVEQAAASALQRPYRQRVYHLRRTGARAYASDVYTMPEPLSYAGWWRTPDHFVGTLGPGDLTLRDGCTIELAPDTLGDHSAIVFTGGTIGTGCESKLGDAAYATSEVELHPDRLLTWDRGFTSEGEQAWGATKSGYVFVRTPE